MVTQKRNTSVQINTAEQIKPCSWIVLGLLVVKHVGHLERLCKIIYAFIKKKSFKVIVSELNNTFIFTLIKYNFVNMAFNLISIFN